MLNRKRNLGFNGEEDQCHIDIQLGFWVADHAHGKKRLFRWTSQKSLKHTIPLQPSQVVSAASFPRKPSGSGFQPPRGHPQAAAGRPPPAGGPVQDSEFRALRPAFYHGSVGVSRVYKGSEVYRGFYFGFSRVTNGFHTWFYKGCLWVL